MVRCGEQRKEKKIKQLTYVHDLKSDIWDYVSPEDSVYGVSWPGEGGRQGATTLDCSGTKPAGQDHSELRMRYGREWVGDTESDGQKEMRMPKAGM